MSKKSRKKKAAGEVAAPLAPAAAPAMVKLPPMWMRWLPVLGIVVLTAMVMSPALWGAYIWDDDAWLTKNTTILQPENFFKIWLDPSATPHYYPLVFTTFWLEHQLWGLGPIDAGGLQRGVGYHIVNLGLHIGAALLIYRILLLLKLPGGALGAFLAAAIWAIHPVNVESVAWVSERKNVLCGIFFFAAVLMAVHFFRLGTDESQPRKRQYALLCIFFVLAMLSKTIACVLPAAVLLLVWWRRGRIRRDEVLWMLPLFAVGLMLAWYTARLEHTQVGATGSEYAFSFMQRVLIAGTDLWFYIGKAFWPWPVVQLYERFDIHAGQPVMSWWYYAAPLAYAAVVVMLFAMRRRIGRGPVAAFLLFFIVLLPALGFVNFYTMVYTFVTDHYQYLGLIIMIVLGVEAVLWGLRQANVARVAPLLFGGIMVVLGMLSFFVAKQYQDPITLWQTNVAEAPRSFAWALLGRAEVRVDREKALEHMHIAESLFPNDFRIANLLGDLYLFKGAETADAAQSRAFIEKATAYLAKGEQLMPEVEKEAKRRYVESEGSRISPDADANTELGPQFAIAKAHFAQNNWDLAITYFTKDLEQFPRNIRAMLFLGNCYMMKDQPRVAEKWFRSAIDIDRNYAEAWFNLGQSLLAQNRRDEAFQAVMKANQIDPNIERKLQQSAGQTR